MNIPPISQNTQSAGIQSTHGVTNPRKPSAPSGVEQATKSFEQMLDSLNTSQAQSDDLVKQLSLGENVDLQQVMIGVEENDVNFRVAMAIRDKLVESYREVMRMQI